MHACRIKLIVTLEGDFVLLRDKRDASDHGNLVKLRQSKTISTHRGTIQHKDIIGKQPRQLVHTSKGTAYRIHEPTLGEYVKLTPRVVTPIYPSDANLIVSLLDIHVDTSPWTSGSDAPLEILEAGTGHGALTLHLSRAIHAGNPAFPRAPSYVSVQTEPEDAVYLGESVSELQDSARESWKSSRGAVVHTLDISEKHSKHAQQIVQGFRRGMYAGNIDFHVGDISAWIASQKAARQTEDPFLSHVILDLPNADSLLQSVATVLHTNGVLAVFNPSITQIAGCVETIRDQKLPYLLDQVVELGASTIRQWDVRQVRPRARKGAFAASGHPSENRSTVSEQGSIDAVGAQQSRDDELADGLAGQQEDWVTVCRPKAGERVVGGGFLGLWRRMELAAINQPVESPDEVLSA